MAALASLDDDAEIERRRRDVNARSARALAAILARARASSRVGRRSRNFVYVEVGEDARAAVRALLREGVIVRPLAGFGAPTAIRVTVGTPEEHAFLARRSRASLERAARTHPAG